MRFDYRCFSRYMLPGDTCTKHETLLQINLDCRFTLFQWGCGDDSMEGTLPEQPVLADVQKLVFDKACSVPRLS